MKKLLTSSYTRLGPLSITLDDIEAIAKLLGEGSPEGVRIRADGYEVETPSELARMNRHRLSNLDLERSDRSLEVSFSDSYAKIRVYGDAPIQQGIATQLERHLASRRQAFYQHRRLPVAVHLLQPLIGILVFFYLSTRIRLGLNGPTLLLAVAYAAYLLSPHLWDRFVAEPHSVIHLRRAIDMPTFWERNKDAIVINILVCVLSGLLGYLLAKL